MGVNELLILASASPRRRQILGVLGIPFEAIEVDVDEAPHPGEAPETLARRLAVAKALAGVTRSADALVLGADTVVALDGESLGKPRDSAEAVQTLERLRARAHSVITGVALATREGSGLTVRDQAAITEVWMRRYSDLEIHEYVATGDPFDKAGSYAIQHAAFRPVERIVGCFLNVVGLPLPEVKLLLGWAGVDAKADAERLDAACSWCTERGARRRRAAADHDQLGVEDVGERDEAGAQVLPRALQYGDGDGVALLREPGQQPAVHGTACGQGPTQRRAGLTFGRHPRGDAHGRPGHVHLKQPWLGQLAGHLRPFRSMMMWPISAAAPLAPRRGRPPQMMPPPTPVPSVSMSMSRTFTPAP